MPSVPDRATERDRQRARSGPGLQHARAGEDVRVGHDRAQVLRVDDLGAARHLQHEVREPRPEGDEHHPLRRARPWMPSAFPITSSCARVPRGCGRCAGLQVEQVGPVALVDRAAASLPRPEHRRAAHRLTHGSERRRALGEPRASGACRPGTTGGWPSGHASTVTLDRRRAVLTTSHRRPSVPGLESARIVPRSSALRDVLAVDSHDHVALASMPAVRGRTVRRGGHDVRALVDAQA